MDPERIPLWDSFLGYDSPPTAFFVKVEMKKIYLNFFHTTLTWKAVGGIYSFSSRTFVLIYCYVLPRQRRARARLRARVSRARSRARAREYLPSLFFVFIINFDLSRGFAIF